MLVHFTENNMSGSDCKRLPFGSRASGCPINILIRYVRLVIDIRFRYFLLGVSLHIKYPQALRSVAIQTANKQRIR